MTEPAEMEAVETLLSLPLLVSVLVATGRPDGADGAHRHDRGDGGGDALATAVAGVCVS